MSDFRADARMYQIVEQMHEIGALPNPTAADEQRFGALRAEWSELNDQRTAALDAVRQAVSAGHVEHTTPAGPASFGSGDVFRSAEQAIAASSRSGLLPDHAAEHATALLERGPAGARSQAARWAAAAADPHYLRAFAAVAMDPQRGHLTWSADELAAYRAANDVHGELRAMSIGTDSAGGWMVPAVLDPAIMLSNAGVASTLRQRARTVTTVGSQWSGITSAGTTSEWLAEATEAADQTPTLANPDIPVHKLSTWTAYSVEVGMDAVNFLAELQRVMLDSATITAETAYAVGTGSGQPTGLLTKLAATPASVISAAGEAITAADVLAVQAALGPRFQANATWAANIATINSLAAIETTNGALRFPEIGEGRLLRRPLDELSPMDGTINAAAAENNYALVYGDLRQAFVIVDRIGATFEFQPMIMGANNRPTGQRGAWLYQRTGSDVVVPNAARVLNVDTTA